MNRTAAFYSRPSYLSGAGAVFSGARRQRGGSILGALKSVVKPIANNLGNSLKTNALGFAKDVVGDIVRGRNVKDTLLSRGKERGLKALKQTFTGPPSKKKKTAKRLSGKRVRQRGRGKRRIPRKRSSRKRRKSHKRAPSAKRRRRNF